MKSLEVVLESKDGRSSVRLKARRGNSKGSYVDCYRKEALQAEHQCSGGGQDRKFYSETTMAAANEKKR